MGRVGVRTSLILIGLCAGLHFSSDAQAARQFGAQLITPQSSGPNIVLAQAKKPTEKSIPLIADKSKQLISTITALTNLLNQAAQSVENVAKVQGKVASLDKKRATQETVLQNEMMAADMADPKVQALLGQIGPQLATATGDLGQARLNAVKNFTEFKGQTK